MAISPILKKLEIKESDITELSVNTSLENDKKLENDKVALKIESNYILNILIFIIYVKLYRNKCRRFNI